jgi:3-deoxy-7-phosphoheptulonate synthase
METIEKIEKRSPIPERSAGAYEHVPCEVGTIAVGETEVMDSELQDTRIQSSEPLVKAEGLHEQFPLSEQAKRQVVEQRRRAAEIVTNPGHSSRLLVVVGPCSIHDTEAALEYADWLKPLQEEHADSLEIIMRTYFEKPRTTIGWKGLINEPDINGKPDINKGLAIARELLVDITERGLGVSTELLDTRTPQYMDDLLVWGAIGARTTESQLHRELASGVSYPVGFKNNTAGNIQVAVDAMVSAGQPHTFIGSSRDNGENVYTTAGNRDTHLILRGGKSGPNFDQKHMAEAEAMLKEAGLASSVMVDFSHANSGKDPKKQKLVATNVAKQIAEGSQIISGVMIESNLVEGNQPIGGYLEYGKSITDACSGLEDTATMLKMLAKAQKARKNPS